MPLSLARRPLQCVGLVGAVQAARPSSPPPVPAQPGFFGTAAPGYEAVAVAFARTLAGRSRGGSLTVRRGTETLVDVWGGWADGRRDREWTSDTPALSFSTTKGIAATAVHVLVDRGILAYDEPVATWWPEFAAAGKERITLRDVLTHRAGLHDVRGITQRTSDILDAELMEERLAAARPSQGDGTPAYHAYTFGWLTGGILRRATGLSPAEAVRTLVAEPLELQGLDIGRPPSSSPAPAEVVGSALRLYGPAERVLSSVWGNVPFTRETVRALVLPSLGEIVYGEDAAIWTTEMPAVNGAFTARGLAGMYAALANGGAVGGKRLMRAATVLQLGKVQSRRRDRVLGLDMRWRVGYHHAFMAGAPARKAFGHYGYGGSGGWADPDSGLSFGYVTNDIGTVTSPVGDRTLFRLSGVVRRCADLEANPVPVRHGRADALGVPAIA
ncbi:MAG: beta-lactamase family protein [Solirubrobacterales bacterium]|nr:beta-lactamase family protein [Solirubrobacterales bacterium]